MLLSLSCIILTIIYVDLIVAVFLADTHSAFPIYFIIEKHGFAEERIFLKQYIMYVQYVCTVESATQSFTRSTKQTSQSAAMLKCSRNSQQQQETSTVDK